MNEVQPFYRFRAEAGDEPASAELLIFDAIGDWAELGEVSAKHFAGELSKLPTSIKRLDIHINSPGGSVSEAMGIYSRLADHRSEKIVYIDGLAASAASLVAMVGHKIYIRSNAQFMIHLPMAIGIGNSDDMRTIAAALDSNTESMLNLYTRRPKALAREKIRSLMRAESWMHADEAVENGFADEVRGVVKAAASIGNKRVIFNGATFDLSRFHNVPEFSGEVTTKGTMETRPTANAPAPTPPTPGPGPTPTPNPPPPTPTPGTGEPPPTSDPPRPPSPPRQAGESDHDRGVQAERDRVSALMKLDKPATHAIIVKAIAEGKQPADIVTELVQAMENANTQGFRHLDASSLTGIPGTDGGDHSAGSDNGQAFATALKAAIEARRRARPKPVTNHTV
jgi:ATP-dependent protease ClpP protease subunit